MALSLVKAEKKDRIPAWRNGSTGEARLRARERAQGIAEHFQSAQQLGRYGYPDRPMREPILETFPDSTGVIARKSYGRTVLNAAQILIADVDIPRLTPSVPGPAHGDESCL
jgi:hypothetical protein